MHRKARWQACILEWSRKSLLVEGTISIPGQHQEPSEMRLTYREVDPEAGLNNALDVQPGENANHQGDNPLAPDEQRVPCDSSRPLPHCPRLIKGPGGSEEGASQGEPPYGSGNKELVQSSLLMLIVGRDPKARHCRHTTRRKEWRLTGWQRDGIPRSYRWPFPSLRVSLV